MESKVIRETTKNPGIRETAHKPGRITTIDTMKGFSMIMIFYCHFSFIWRTGDWVSFMRIQWLLLDFFGPVMFISMSVLGTMSSNLNREPGEKKEAWSRRSLLKISFLFIIGEMINAYTLGSIGIYHVFAWNIVTAIAVFSLLMPAILQLKPAIRMGLIAVIAILYFPLLQLTQSSINAAGLDGDSVTPDVLHDLPTMFYYLFFHQGMVAPVFPWLIVPLASSIVFEPFFTKFKNASPGAIRFELKKICYAGIVFIAASIVSGMQLSPGFGSTIMRELNTPSSFYTWPYPQGVPMFLIRHTPQYLFYNLGIVCVLFAVLANWQLVNHRKISGEDKINNLGTLSLTAFVFSHVSWIVPWIKLDVILFFVVFVPLIIAIVYFFWLWTRKWKIKLTLEWFMGVYVKVLSRWLENREITKKGERSGDA
nr:hypothetical protein [Candidatus Sigynarchaeota archaeon]